MVILTALCGNVVQAKNLKCEVTDVITTKVVYDDESTINTSIVIQCGEDGDQLKVGDKIKVTPPRKVKAAIEGC